MFHSVDEQCLLGIFFDTAFEKILLKNHVVFSEHCVQAVSAHGIFSQDQTEGKSLCWSLGCLSLTYRLGYRPLYYHAGLAEWIYVNHVHVRACIGQKRVRITWNLSSRQLWAAIWVLRAGPGSSARAAGALNYLSALYHPLRHSSPNLKF